MKERQTDRQTERKKHRMNKRKLKKNEATKSWKIKKKGKKNRYGE